MIIPPLIKIFSIFVFYYEAFADWCYVEALGTQEALKYSKQKKSKDNNKSNKSDKSNESNGNSGNNGDCREDEEIDDFNTMPTPEDLLKMRSCSPIIHVKNVRAPVLMLIGAKDRRVPMSQGVAYYHTLRAKGAYHF